MSRIVVSGGAGFLGSHLCEALLDRGDYVVAIDNLVTGRLANIEHLFGDERFVFQHHDVSNHVHVSGRVDAVMHLASPASPKDFAEIPIQILKVGSLGTHNLLGLAKDKRARFFLASTSEVYGDPLVHPQPESYWGNVNPIGPRGVYDEAKRFAEAMAMAYHRHHGVDVRIVRIFNTYGPRLRVDDGRVVSNFVVQAIHGKPITIYGDGTQTRSFCYVDDEIRGFLALLDSDHVGPMNIGNPTEFTVRQLAEQVLELTGSASELVNEPLPVDDPTQRRPDIGLARRKLGWEPQIDLRTGLQRTIEWFRGEVVDEVSSGVAAVIVSYNVRDLVLRCIGALRADGIDEIVVVDNASSDGSAAAVRRHEPDVDLVALSTNVGFAAGVNRAVDRTSTPAVLIVNPDVVVEPGSTKELVDVLDSQPDVGIAAPLIETDEGRVYESARRFPSFGDALGHAFLHFVWPSNPFSRRYKMADWDHGPSDVDWVAGTHLLVRRKAWSEVGGFDERFFMYMEDVDLCRSMWRAGWRVRYEPRARIIHGIGRSTDQTPYRMIRMHHVSMYRYVDKTWTGPQRSLLPFVAAALVLRTGFAWLQRSLRGRPHAAH